METVHMATLGDWLRISVDFRGVPVEHLCYEAAFFALFFAALVHAARISRKAVLRVFSICLFGTVVETSCYIGMQLAGYQNVGRLYDHGRFAVTIGSFHIPIYMMPMWYAVTMGLADEAARRYFRTSRFLARVFVAAALAISLDLPIEPIAVMRNWWRYRVAQTGTAHWGGVIFANTFAWVGLQGGISGGLWLQDKVFQKEGSAYGIRDVASVIFGAVSGLVVMSVWFAFMTLMRPPIGIVQCFSDAALLVAAGCLILAPFVITHRVQYEPAGTGFRWWPFVMCLVWHALHLAFFFPVCDSPYHELCTPDGILLTLCYSVVSIAMFVPPRVLKAVKQKESLKGKEKAF